MLRSEPLYYLLEVGRCQSMTAAAEKLHVTQPTLSIAIKNLESDLGVKLIERMYHGVYLTEDGEKIVELAEKAFSYFTEIENYAKQIQTAVPPSITVYSTQAFNATLITILVSKYYDQYPSGSFSCFPIGEQPPEEILSKHPDAFVFAILNKERQFPDDIESVILDESKAYLAMHKDAPFLPQDVKSISLKECAHIPLITTTVAEEQSFLNERLSSIRKYAEPNIRFNATSMDMSSSLIQQKLGATLYTSFKHVKYYQDSNLRIVLIKKAPKFVLTVLFKRQIDPQLKNFFFNFLKRNLL